MSDPISEALAVFPDKQRAALESVRSTLESLLPDARWDLSWGMPTLRIDGIIVTSLLGFTNHNSLFPGPEVHAVLGEALKGYDTTKGTIHFQKEKAPPKSFLKALVEARISVINAGFPKKSGEFKEFYTNGRLKATGRYKNGQMHGAWTFYRLDGSRMRSGSFAEGQQVCTWTTYTADGAAHTTTEFPKRR